MPETIVVIAVLAVVLLALGVGLARRRPVPPREAESRAEERPAPEAATAVETAPAPVAPIEEERPSLRERLRKSRKFLSDRLADVLGADDDETWEDLEAVLIQADLGPEVAAQIESCSSAAARKVSAAASNSRSGRREPAQRS